VSLPSRLPSQAAPAPHDTYIHGAADAPGFVPLPTPPLKRAALSGIVISTLAIASGYASAFVQKGGTTWGTWAFALGTTGVLVSTLALGATQRRGGLGKLVLPLALVALLLGGGFCLVLWLPDLGSAEPLVLGLPRRAAIILYGVGLLPIVVLPVAYALTFADQTLRPEDLERVLEAARAARADAALRDVEGAR
jgi:hypothetical protein